jgi:hypothetical protein
MALDPRLGVDSVKFPTFGWDQMRDEPTARAWISDDGTLLTVHFFPVTPDLPGLETEELERYFGTHQHDEASRPLVIELEVVHDHSVPLIRVITREHLPARDRYAFQAALIAPVARCHWVVKVAQVEGDVTGVREALAFDKFARAHPDRIDGGPPFDGFDPYGREWDGDRVPDAFDPLSAVRRYLADLEAALTFGPEVVAEPPFSPIP